MVKLWQRTMKGEKGQVLPGILILLALGTLLIAPALNYAATSLYAGRIAEENMRGALAADAGVEHVLWSLINSGSLPDPYPPLENVNEMQVTIETDPPKGTYTLYNGELVEVKQPPQTNYDYLGIESEMVWIEPAGPYRCTITVTWHPLIGEETIHLSEVGVRLPPGYTYQPGSAALFPGNLSEDDPPPAEPDWAGAHMLNWVFGSPPPSVSKKNQEAFQDFYVTGEGEPEGYYAWVDASPEAIGQVGENTGILYSIRATATRPGDGEITTGKVMADVLLDVDEQTAKIYILFWRTSPQ